jgi:hypothetical protein
MVASDMQETSELTAPMAGRIESGLEAAGAALLNGFSSAIESKAKELVGSGLEYLLACNLMLIADVKNLPPEVNDILNDLGCTNLAADGNTLRMNLRAAKNKTFDGCPPMWFDKNVSADIRRTENRIELNNIKGIMVDPGSRLPWANIKSAVIEKDGTRCIATVRAGRFGVNHTEKIELPVELYHQIEGTLKANGL